MLQNRLIVTKKSDKEKICDLSKNKWIIELDGDKIHNWNDFYDVMQKEIDVLDYNSLYGRNGYTYEDFATDISLFNEVKRKNMKGIVIILNYTDNFKKISEGEKGYIYYDTIFTLLLDWYRDLRIIYKQEKPTINIEMYILVNDNLLKNVFNFKNELTIAIEEDINEINNKFIDYELIKLEAVLDDENFLMELDKKLKSNDNRKEKVLILKSDNLRFIYRRHILVDIIENILIKKYKENKEVKIYMVFSNSIP